MEYREEMVIHMEICQRCFLHPEKHHSEIDFHSHFNLFKEACKDSMLKIKIIKNGGQRASKDREKSAVRNEEDNSSRIGAFQIYHKNLIVFSKLKSQQFPMNYGILVAIIQSLHKTGNQIQRVAHRLNTSQCHSLYHYLQVKLPKFTIHSVQDKIIELSKSKVGLMHYAKRKSYAAVSANFASIRTNETEDSQKWSQQKLIIQGKLDSKAFAPRQSQFKRASLLKMETGTNFFAKNLANQKENQPIAYERKSKSSQRVTRKTGPKESIAKQKLSFIQTVIEKSNEIHRYLTKQLDKTLKDVDDDQICLESLQKSELNDSPTILQKNADSRIRTKRNSAQKVKTKHQSKLSTNQVVQQINLNQDKKQTSISKSKLNLPDPQNKKSILKCCSSISSQTIRLDSQESKRNIYDVFRLTDTSKSQLLMKSKNTSAPIQFNESNQQSDQVQDKNGQTQSQISTCRKQNKIEIPKLFNICFQLLYQQYYESCLFTKLKIFNPGSQEMEELKINFKKEKTNKYQKENIKQQIYHYISKMKDYSGYSMSDYFKILSICPSISIKSSEKNKFKKLIISDIFSNSSSENIAKVFCLSNQSSPLKQCICQIVAVNQCNQNFGDSIIKLKIQNKLSQFTYREFSTCFDDILICFIKNTYQHAYTKMISESEDLNETKTPKFWNISFTIGKNCLSDNISNSIRLFICLFQTTQGKDSDRNKEQFVITLQKYKQNESKIWKNNKIAFVKDQILGIIRKKKSFFFQLDVKPGVYLLQIQKNFQLSESISILLYGECENLQIKHSQPSQQKSIGLTSLYEIVKIESQTSA